ncbi:MAG: molybdopterin-dependent oxidoreductase [Pseudohongiellaceae bacterium]
MQPDIHSIRCAVIRAPGRGDLLKALRQAALKVLLLATLAVPVWAEPLLITGPDGEFSFSQQDILAMSDQEVITETPWTDGTMTFRGASLAAVLSEVGIEQGWVNARGLNNYAVNLPIEQVFAAKAFLAVHMNGELMRIKDKGPFWIIFPWDEHPDLLTREIRSWSVWQLQALSVLD